MAVLIIEDSRTPREAVRMELDGQVIIYLQPGLSEHTRQNHLLRLLRPHELSALLEQVTVRARSPRRSARPLRAVS